MNDITPRVSNPEFFLLVQQRWLILRDHDWRPSISVVDDCFISPFNRHCNCNFGIYIVFLWRLFLSYKPNWRIAVWTCLAMGRISFCLASSNHHASFRIFPDDLEMKDSKPEFCLYVWLFLIGLVVEYESGLWNVDYGNYVCNVYHANDFSWCDEYHYWLGI